MSTKWLLIVLGALLSVATLISTGPERFLYLAAGLVALVLVYIVQQKALAMKLSLALTALLFALYYVMLSRLYGTLEPYWIVLTILTMVLLIVLKGLKR